MSIFLCFSLSYLLRYIWNVFLLEGFYLNNKSFGKWLLHDAVILFDGLSLLALILTHYQNFNFHVDRDIENQEGILYFPPDTNDGESESQG